LRGGIELFPGFEPSTGAPAIVDLDTRIADAVNKRLKDAKVVEIEITQAIAERVFGWSKSFALLVGIPLALLGVILGILGIKSYTDFTALVTDARTEVTVNWLRFKRRGLPEGCR